MLPWAALLNLVPWIILTKMCFKHRLLFSGCIMKLAVYFLIVSYILADYFRSTYPNVNSSRSFSTALVSLYFTPIVHL